jgi:hypothetical protein
LTSSGPRPRVPRRCLPRPRASWSAPRSQGRPSGRR